MNRKMNTKKKKLARRRAKKRAALMRGNASVNGPGGGLLETVLAALENDKLPCTVNEHRDAGLVECHFYPIEETSYRNAVGRTEVNLSITADDVEKFVTVSAKGVWNIGTSPHREPVRQTLTRIVAFRPEVEFVGPDADGSIDLNVQIPESDIDEYTTQVVADAISQIMRFIDQSDPMIQQAMKSGSMTVDAAMFDEEILDEWEIIRRREGLVRRLNEERHDRLLKLGEMMRAYFGEHAKGVRARFDTLYSVPYAIAFLRDGNAAVGTKYTIPANFEEEYLRAAKAEIGDAVRQAGGG